MSDRTDHAAAIRANVAKMRGGPRLDVVQHSSLDAISDHATALQKDRDRWIQTATWHMSYIREFADERDALGKRVERLAGAFLKLWKLHGGFKGNVSLEFYGLMPGDLGDETEEG